MSIATATSPSGKSDRERTSTTMLAATCGELVDANKEAVYAHHSSTATSAQVEQDEMEGNEQTLKEH